MSDERAVISATPTQCAARRAAVHDCVQRARIYNRCKLRMHLHLLPAAPNERAAV